MLESDHATSSDIDKKNYSALNSEHSWEDLCIQLRNQQACTSDNQQWIRVSPIANLIFADVSS